METKNQNHLKITPSNFIFPYDEERQFGYYRLTPYHDFVYSLFRRNLLPRDFVFDNFLRLTARHYENGIVDATISGISMRMNALAKACSSTENPIFVDVGANVGLYSLLLTKAVPEVRVLAYEPHPGLCKQMKYNLSINTGHRISVFEFAISDQPGKAWLKTNTRNLGQTRLESDGDVEVECTTLQAVVEREQLSHIDALKIDIEGHEDKALNPYLRDAPESLLPRAIVCEVNKKIWKNDPLEIALARGYREIKTFSWNRRQKNYIFVYSN